jgi:hypothetical protein
MPAPSANRLSKVCHDVCMVIKSQIDLGVGPGFWPENDGPRDVLRMPVRC